ncbi:pinin-like [Xenopus tropicalis]|uniref:Pinin-like n=1 Tax=Xenopus tropicalis TaxID=8364 RepID=A0A8J1JSA5_XENTR|nr:pinin-like [Xenopus tropicalis]
MGSSEDINRTSAGTAGNEKGSNTKVQVVPPPAGQTDNKGKVLFQTEAKRRLREEEGNDGTLVTRSREVEEENEQNVKRIIKELALEALTQTPKYVNFQSFVKEKKEQKPIIKTVPRMAARRLSEISQSEKPNFTGINDYLWYQRYCTKCTKDCPEKCKELASRFPSISSLRPQPSFESSLQPQPSSESSLQPQPSSESSLQPQPSSESSLQPQPSSESSLQPQPSSESSLQPQPSSESSLQPQPSSESSLQPKPSSVFSQ